MTATNMNVNPMNAVEMINHSAIDQLARKATAGTLKKIYSATGNENIRQFCINLQSDFSLFDNNIAVTPTGKAKTISDAYDIYLAAYTYLWDMIINKEYSPESEISLTLKNGNEKIRTVFQWACVEVRRYIYRHATTEMYNSTKTVKHSDGTKTQYKTVGYTYIEDLSKSKDETGMEALDREYIRMDKYNGINTYSNYVQYANIIQLFNDMPRLADIIKLRMQGASVTAIAEKLDVSHQAVSKQLIKAQTIINDNFPELTRGFKSERNYNNNISDNNIKFWSNLMKSSF